MRSNKCVMCASPHNRYTVWMACGVGISVFPFNDLIQSKYGKKESQTIYVLCDEELCMSVHAFDDRRIDDLVFQISTRRLHDKSFNSGGEKSGAAR